VTELKMPRLALADLNLQRKQGTTAREQLTALNKDAKAKEFTLVASRAAAKM